MLAGVSNEWTICKKITQKTGPESSLFEIQMSRCMKGVKHVGAHPASCMLHSLHVQLSVNMIRSQVLITNTICGLLYFSDIATAKSQWVSVNSKYGDVLCCLHHKVLKIEKQKITVVQNVVVARYRQSNHYSAAVIELLLLTGFNRACFSQLCLFYQLAIKVI